MAPNRNPAVATLADRAQSPPVDSAFWLDAWREELIFFRCDEDEVLTYVSPSVRTILGYRPQELLGRPTREVFSVDHPLCASWHAAAAEAPASLAGQEQRCVARRHDGQNALFLLRERPLVDESGRPAGREAMAQDVTRRIEAELRLRQSERKYRRLVEQFRGDYIIYTRNLRGMLTYVSPSIETMLGVAPDQIVGRTWREVLGNVRRTQAAESWVRDGDDPAHPVRQVVIALTRADGAARMFEIQEWSLYDISGSALAVEGIAKDITDAHQAKIAARQLKEDLERQVALRTEEFRRINEDLLRINEELRASEARYRSVVDTQSEFIVRWRADGTRTFVNESYCRFLGAEARELLGGRIASVIHPDDLHRVADFLQSVSPQNPYSTGEARLLAAQGE
ncbi:MAG TPA: PAS domain S-box protein, partial [Lacipirellulaceae bacterium]|nr:PAS domain S-box protein [Lacipirellulaceae bacterium]